MKLIKKNVNRIQHEAVSKVRKSLICHSERSEESLLHPTLDSSLRCTPFRMTLMRQAQSIKSSVEKWGRGNFKLLKLSLPIILLLFFLVSCGDSPPVNYIVQNWVEGYIFVDYPINNFIVMQSQPVQDTFNLYNAQIHDADVIINDGTNDLKLQFQNDTLGYYYPDTTYKIKPNTLYKLKVTLHDGTVISAQTTTPNRTAWIIAPKDVIYFPKDTNALPTVDSIGISWQNVILPDVAYIIRNRCLDTLGYGIYLTPPTNELNRRTNRKNSYSSRPSDIASWNESLTSSNSVTWGQWFKWYGKQDVTVYVPDQNFSNWFTQLQRGTTYDPTLSNIVNGSGIFCSASYVTKQFFLMKNQP